MIKGENYIGKSISSLGNRTFKTFNPKLNLENETIFYEANQQEIDNAAILAHEAFYDYKKISGIEKSKFLIAIAEEIENLGDNLLQVFCLESGLTKDRARSEKERTLWQLKMFANLIKKGSWVEASIDTAIPNRIPIAKPDLRKMMFPIGPVVVFGASNFPLAYSTAGGDTVSALAAGCPVIVKSHPMHAGTGELVAFAIIKAAKRTGMPNGVFSNLNSSGIEVGVDLVKHPLIKAVGFTGSVTGGRALFDLANQRKEPIPVFAEMGSVNPVVLLPNSVKNNFKKLANTYANSITLGSGQFCTNPGLIIGIKSDSLNKFIQELASEIVKVEPSCMLHPKIIGNYEKNKDKVESQKGVSVEAEFEQSASENYGRQVIMTVEGETFLENTTLHHEVFGPFSLVVQCEDSTQLLKIIDGLEGQLTGTIWAEKNEVKKYEKVINALQNKVGRIIFSGVSTGVEVCDSMNHGGPYPASTDSRFTAVGVHSIKRWARPLSFQNWPNQMLPVELQDKNPLGIIRNLNGEYTTRSI